MVLNFLLLYSFVSQYRTQILLELTITSIEQLDRVMTRFIRLQSYTIKPKPNYWLLAGRFSRRCLPPFIYSYTKDTPEVLASIYFSGSQNWYRKHKMPLTLGYDDIINKETLLSGQRSYKRGMTKWLIFILSLSHSLSFSLSVLLPSRNFLWFSLLSIEYFLTRDKLWMLLNASNVR